MNIAAKGKIMVMSLLLAVTMLALSLGTSALLSHQATGSKDTITTGTLYIGGETGNKGVLDTVINLSGLIPGAEPQQVEITVKNLGSMTGYVNALSVDIAETDDKFLANALKAELTDDQGNILFKGSLLALDDNAVPFSHKIILEPDQTTQLNISLQLDERAGNWYKGKTIDFTLSVYAGQEPDQQCADTATVAGPENAQQLLDNAQPGDIILLSAGSYGCLEVKSPVKLKSLDVIYDAVLAGVLINSTLSNEGSLDSEISIQGFTVNNREACGIRINGNQPCTITDNIINCPASALETGCPDQMTLTRNDFTGSLAKNAQTSWPEYLQTNNKVRYNLGIDLDPVKYAL